MFPQQRTRFKRLAAFAGWLAFLAGFALAAVNDRAALPTLVASGVLLGAGL